MPSSQPRINKLLSLHGKTALITGAAVGIGRAIADRLAEAGAELILIDVDRARLARARTELADHRRPIMTHVVDLAQKEAIDALWAEIPGDGPEILVNNAGIYPFKSFLDIDEGFLRQVMETNLHSVTWMCQNMIRRRLKLGGIIINIASIEAVQPFKSDLAHYSVSKAGVIALTRALAKEHSQHGFRVNAVLPGGIVTRGTKTVAKQVLRMQLGLLKVGYDFKQRLPVGRLGQPDEVARVVLMLASDLASYVHGAAIPVDGGFLAA